MTYLHLEILQGFRSQVGCIARPKKLKEAAPPRESRLRRKKKSGFCVKNTSETSMKMDERVYERGRFITPSNAKPYVLFRCPVTRAARALGKAVAGTSDGSGGVFLCSWSYELLMS